MSSNGEVRSTGAAVTRGIPSAIPAYCNRDLHDPRPARNSGRKITGNSLNAIPIPRNKLESRGSAGLRTEK